MKTGDTILLAGRTLKGKNRVREHGTAWTVAAVRGAVDCLGGAPGVLVHPAGAEEALRWVLLDGGPDFNVKETE